jgi:hypothetical protein
MAIKLTIELIRFLNAAKRLYDQGLMGKEEILNFARREFGEITGVLKTRLDQIFKKPATGIKRQETKKGEVVELRPKADDVSTSKPVIKKDKSRVDEIMDDMNEIELFEDTPKEMTETALNTLIKKRNDRRRLGTISQDANARTAIREFLSRRLKDGTLKIPDAGDRDAIERFTQGADPIDIFRKAYGEDAIGVVARIQEEFPDAFRGNTFTEIGDEFERLYKLEAENFSNELPKPKAKYGFDEGLMTDEELIRILRKDLEEKQKLEDFDVTGREPNEAGGIAGILKL